MAEDGVLKISPVNATWYLDKDKQLPVQRRGYTVASAFSGTAHSFAGESLTAAWIDCLPWTTKPDKAAQLRSDLHRWRKSIQAQMPTKNPDHDPKRATQVGKKTS